MKLKSIYISSFGNLADYKLDFSDGLNSYCYENGYGKSTINYFIRSMFYGLPKSSKNQFLRKRVMPYSKVQFGGYLIFEFNKKIYKIERTFAKSNTDDTLTVYLNGKETKELGDIPGVTVFNLDEESFNKTIFITSKDLGFSAEGELKSKLGHYVSSDEETTSFVKAIEKLEKYRKSFVPDKDKDKYGLIAEKKHEINDLINEQSQLNELNKSLDLLKENINGYDEKIEKNKQEINDAIKANDLLNEWQKYDDYQLKINSLTANIAHIKSSYPLGIPLDEEIEIIKNKQKEKEKINSQLKALELTDSEKVQLSELNRHFAEAFPSDLEIQSIKEKHEKYRTLLNEKDDVLTEKETKLILQFDGKNIDENALKNDVEEYRKLNVNYSFSSSPSMASGDKSKPIKEIVFGVIGFIVIVLGVILGIFVNPLLFILSGVGFLLLLFAGFIYLKNQINNKGNASSYQEANSKLKEDRYKLFLKISNALDKFGYSLLNEENLEEIYATFSSDFKAYKEAKSTQKAVDDANIAKKNALNELEKELTNFYDKFHYLGDENSKFEKLNKDILLYKNINERINNLKSSQESLLKINKNYEDDIASFKGKYSINDLDVYFSKLEKDKVQLDVYQKELTQVQDESKLYFDKHPLKDRPNNSQKIDVEDLNSKNNELMSQRAKIAQQINTIENEISNKKDKLSFLDQYNDELNTLKEKYEITKKTIDCLKKAEDSLKAKYIDPIKDSLIKYISPLEESLGKKLGLDADFNLYFIEDGKQRDYRHLSDGQLTLVLFCYKLAILDNIFTEDKPFIILDDVFAYLDKDNLLKASELLKKIASSRQIVYFTCHTSRKID